MRRLLLLTLLSQSLLVLASTPVELSIVPQHISPRRSFSIDYHRKTFLLDGKPFRYVSGSLHYFRIPPAYWNDRLKKLRAAGLNAVQVYVEWRSHEQEHERYDFSGASDIVKFIKLAQANDLLVLLRPGPYIDAERDMGGLPFWLLHKHKDIKLRTPDPNFLGYVDKWFAILFERLRPLIYENGGPIIMVQSENEYGSFATQTKKSNTEYLIHMRDLLRKHVGSRTLLYSTDGCSVNDVGLSRTAGVYSTVDFSSTDNPKKCFHVQRLFEPHGPNVNSEYYPGWLDNWAIPHHTVPIKPVIENLDKMLLMGGNVNMYMFHGGTSFGFGAGANSPPFRPEITSYDYDAPITEAGDLTDKYFAIQEVIGRYLPIPHIHVNSTVDKGNYGYVNLMPVGSLFTDTDMLSFDTRTSRWPITFEEFGMGHGLLMYQTTISQLFSDPAQLSITGLRDRGYVFVDQQLQGILSRIGDIYTMPLSIRPGQKLQIIVENQGRICFGPNINDFKGITSNVTIGGHKIQQWRITGYSFQHMDDISRVFRKRRRQMMRNPSIDSMPKYQYLKSQLTQNKGSLSFWVGTFRTPCDDAKGKDTFLSLSGWRKGLAFINGFNLGRYWPVMGPQETLYVPGVHIKPKCAINTLVIFEQDAAPCLKTGSSAPTSCRVHLGPTPKINGPTPTL